MNFSFPIALCFQRNGVQRRRDVWWWSVQSKRFFFLSPGATVFDGQAIRSCAFYLWITHSHWCPPLVSYSLCRHSSGKSDGEVFCALLFCFAQIRCLPTARQLEAWLPPSDSVNKQPNWRFFVFQPFSEGDRRRFQCPQDVDGHGRGRGTHLFIAFSFKSILCRNKWSKALTRAANIVSVRQTLLYNSAPSPSPQKNLRDKETKDKLRVGTKTLPTKNRKARVKISLGRTSLSMR